MSPAHTRILATEKYKHSTSNNAHCFDAMAEAAEAQVEGAEIHQGEGTGQEPGKGACWQLALSSVQVCFFSQMAIWMAVQAPQLVLREGRLG